MKNFNNRVTLPDFSFWCEIDAPVTGVTKKLWLTNGKYKALFKFGEEWTEQIASNIAQLLKIPCMKCHYGTYIGNYGVLCFDIGETKDVGLLFDSFSDSYADSTFSLDGLRNQITYSVFVSILNMLIFDYLIGNRDRHISNFAFTHSGDLAPLFDNAASLCYGLSVNRAKYFLSNSSELYTYSFDLMSHVRIPNRCSNLELVFHIKDTYPSEWNLIVSKFIHLDLSHIKKILVQFKGIVPPQVLRCIFYGIDERLQMLKSI